MMVFYLTQALCVYSVISMHYTDSSYVVCHCTECHGVLLLVSPTFLFQLVNRFCKQFKASGVENKWNQILSENFVFNLCGIAEFVDETEYQL